MATFILIHGGYHGGWCWEYLTPLLEAAGHRTLAPNLPGMAGEPTPFEQVTLKLTADAVADLVRAQKGPVILAGHSLGGVTISEVAERIPEKIAGLIYLTAILLPNGVSVADRIPQLTAPMEVIPSPDGFSVNPNPKEAKSSFYNTTDAARAEQAIARLTPQPMTLINERLKLSDSRFGRVRRAFIECIRDKALPLASQRLMQKELPCDPVVTLDTDHSPFLCAPDQLAQAFIQISDRFV
jgi:pimeloyl-ACP methyl ester carboxylesterase